MRQENTIIAKAYTIRLLLLNIENGKASKIGSPHINMLDIRAPIIAKSLKQISQHKPIVYDKNIGLKYINFLLNLL